MVTLVYVWSTLLWLLSGAVRMAVWIGLLGVKWNFIAVGIAYTSIFVLRLLKRLITQVLPHCQRSLEDSFVQVQTVLYARNYSVVFFLNSWLQNLFTTLWLEYHRNKIIEYTTGQDGLHGKMSVSLNSLGIVCVCGGGEISIRMYSGCIVF